MEPKISDSDIKYIKTNARFKVDSMDLFGYYFLFFIINAAFYFPMSLVDISNVVRLLYSLLFSVALLFVVRKLVATYINQVSFKTFNTKYDKASNFKIASTILSELSLPSSVSNNGNDILYSSYYYGALNLYKRDVYFIIDDSFIMLNIRNSNQNIISIFKDTNRDKIVNALIDRIENNKLMIFLTT